MLFMRRLLTWTLALTFRSTMRARTFLLIAATVLSACERSTGPAEVQPEDPNLPDASHVVGLAMAFQTTCALTADGKLHCWGENRFGEFGNGTSAPSAVPVAAGGELSFDWIAGSMGTPQMCGVTSEGDAYCWGYNTSGELGDGTTVNRNLPVRVIADLDFRALASSYHTCGITTEGTAYCWGSGLGGQLGTGDGASTSVPARVQTEALYSTITNGMQFSCALTLVGDAQCWGWGAGLGSGPADRSVNVPTPVSGGLKFQSISAGEEHVCAATVSGQVYCWGKLTAFYPEGFRPTPVRIDTPAPIVSVVSGSRVFVGGASCGLDAQGVAYCWHSGRAAERVPGGRRYAGLAGGHGQFCGYTPGGSAYCWHWTSAGGDRLVLSTPRPIPALGN